jgi:hypothetical protein
MHPGQPPDCLPESRAEYSENSSTLSTNFYSPLTLLLGPSWAVLKVVLPWGKGVEYKQSAFNSTVLSFLFWYPSGEGKYLFLLSVSSLDKHSLAEKTSQMCQHKQEITKANIINTNPTIQPERGSLSDNKWKIKSRSYDHRKTCKTRRKYFATSPRDIGYFSILSSDIWIHRRGFNSRLPND